MPTFLFVLTLMAGGLGAGQYEYCKDNNIGNKECVQRVVDARKADYSNLNE